MRGEEFWPMHDTNTTQRVSCHDAQCSSRSRQHRKQTKDHCRPKNDKRTLIITSQKRVPNISILRCGCDEHPTAAAKMGKKAPLPPSHPAWVGKNSPPHPQTTTTLFSMFDDLLSRAREQADRSTPPIRTAALMRIARVESRLDHDKARATFRLALEEISAFPRRERQSLLMQAGILAAAFSPDLLREIPFARIGTPDFGSSLLLKTMLDHGYVDAAIDYAMRSEGSAFPFTFIGNLMHRVEDESVRLALLRRAIEAWRSEPADEFNRPFRFTRLIQSQWKQLPLDEARDLAREIVRITLEQPDGQIKATYDEGNLVITSAHQKTLFEILHILRHVDEALAQSLIASHSQLATAAHRYPFGIETMIEEAEERRKQIAPGESCSEGFILAGSGRDFPYQKSLIQASRDGNFDQPIQYALEKYNEDTAPESPNQAPKAAWPSTSSFRTILYQAGKQHGAEAAIHLDRIPDPDLRLFAQIELAAALAGLPEIQGIQQEYRPRPRPPRDPALPPMRTPDGTEVRCPECKESPTAEDRWPCKCGHVWNTFWTRGQCPACHYQWTVTQCPQCDEVSPHEDWYVTQ